MRIFFSVGEPSGDIHGANLIRALEQSAPGVDCVGFGGEQMRAAGCDLFYPLCQHAIMGVSGVIAQATTFIKLVNQADQYFRDQRPDAVVLIDYPGFNWWIARRARAQRIPVFYFVPPQLWAWAGWRVHKMRRFVDHVLCTLPFELPWYRSRRIAARYVGHPFFDELPRQKLDDAFLKAATRTEAPIVGLLPGSRNEEIERNWSMQYQSAAQIHAARPDVRFLVACFNHRQQKSIEAHLQQHPPLPIETHVGRTPEIIESATACITVSGSVSLELLWRTKPSVVVYRVNRLYRRLLRFVVKVPYVCLVNLLAEKELFPEFLTDRCESQAIAAQILTWLDNPVAYAELRGQLRTLRDRVAAPGACEKAARHILNTLGQSRVSQAA